MPTVPPSAPSGKPAASPLAERPDRAHPELEGVRAVPRRTLALSGPSEAPASGKAAPHSLTGGSCCTRETGGEAQCIPQTHPRRPR